jgi:phospholipid/cholesterol/gamma-HCH transport system permease protein
LLAAILLGGQVLVHLIRGKINRRNTLEQMATVGPDSLFIALLTAVFVGAVFTIQVAREFINFGAGNRHYARHRTNRCAANVKNRSD